MPRKKYVQPVPPQISFQPQDAPKLPIDPDASIKSLKKRDAIEFRPEVRQAYRKAWMAASAGQTRQEAEFSTAPGRSGEVIRPIEVTDDNQMEGVGRVNAHVMPNDQIIFHTHSKYKDAKPSSTDIASAKSSGKPILVGSRDGLFEIDPNTGKTEQLANGLDWTDPNKDLPGEDESNVGYASAPRYTGRTTDATLGRHIKSKSDPTVRITVADPSVNAAGRVTTTKMQGDDDQSAKENFRQSVLAQQQADAAAKDAFRAQQRQDSSTPAPSTPQKSVRRVTVSIASPSATQRMIRRVTQPRID